MELTAAAVAFLVVALPVVGLLALAAWLVERRVGRVRVVDRHGRTVAEVVLGRDPGRG